MTWLAPTRPSDRRPTAPPRPPLPTPPPRPAAVDEDVADLAVAHGLRQPADADLALPAREPADADDVRAAADDRLRGAGLAAHRDGAPAVLLGVGDRRGQRGAVAAERPAAGHRARAALGRA